MPPSERKGLYTLLSASSELTDIVTGGIYSEVLPEGFQRPCLLFTGMSGVPDLAMSGLTGLVQERRIQFDLLAETDDQDTIESIRNILINLLDLGYTSVTADGGTFEIQEMYPLSMGNYLPDPAGMRYTIDFYMSFGFK